MFKVQHYFLKGLFLIMLISYCKDLSAQNNRKYIPDHPPAVPAWTFRPWVWEDSINTRDGAMKILLKRLKKKGNILSLSFKF